MKSYGMMGVFFLFLFASCSNGMNSGSPLELKKIVFMGTTGSYYDIYIMNENGSNLTNLTNTAASSEVYPSWSPDGKKIYFLKQENSKFYLYVMNSDGTGQTKVTTEAIYNFSYAISPDGTKVAFTGDDGDREIYVVNIDGSELTKLTNNSNQDIHPAWSPDGQGIAYLFKNTSTNKVDLCTIKVDGTNNFFITEGGDVAENLKPFWSPDGTKISFTRYGKFWSTNDNYELFSIQSNGSNMVNISNNSNDDYSPLWSPDGTKIVFVSNRDGNFNIFLSSASNPNNLQRLTDNPREDKHPSWSPDGTRLVYVCMTDDSPTKGQIFVMNADGSNKVRLVTDATLDCSVPLWQP